MQYYGPLQGFDFFFFFPKQLEQVTLKDYFPVFSSNELPQKVPSKKPGASWEEEEFTVLLAMVLLIHRSPGCIKELLTAFLCPSDAKRGYGRIN